jgi:tetratricopeptide (TPR) repeat protein
MLQVIADAMGSDNQLIHEPGHNNYALDDVTARVWAQLGNPANAVGGINHGGNQYYKCFAYFKLNHYQDAVDECTRILDTYGDSLLAHYYRARANEGLRNWDVALREFGPIADGENNYIRVGAAIDMDHINALRGNYAGELAILGKYTYLFDASLQPPDDLVEVRQVT